MLSPSLAQEIAGDTSAVVGFNALMAKKLDLRVERGRDNVIVGFAASPLLGEVAGRLPYVKRGASRQGRRRGCAARARRGDCRV